MQHEAWLPERIAVHGHVQQRQQRYVVRWRIHTNAGSTVTNTCATGPNTDRLPGRFPAGLHRPLPVRSGRRVSGLREELRCTLLLTKLILHLHSH